jgi:hypothetical protein
MLETVTLAESELEAIEQSLGIKEEEIDKKKELRGVLVWYVRKAMGEPQRAHAPADDTLKHLKSAAATFRDALLAADASALFFIGVCGGEKWSNSNLAGFESRVDEFHEVLERAVLACQSPKKRGPPFNAQHQLLGQLLRGVEKYFTGKNTVYSRKTKKDGKQERTGPLFLMFRLCSEAATWNLSDSAIEGILSRLEKLQGHEKKKRKSGSKRSDIRPTESLVPGVRSYIQGHSGR